MSLAKYYHLFAGEVFFNPPDQPDMQGSLKINTLVTTTGPLVTAKDIGIAQQGMQKTFFEKIEGADAKVYDIFIISINSLGKMTQEQFTKSMDGIQTGQNLGEREIGGNMALADPFKVN